MRAGMMTGGLGWVRASANGSAANGFFRRKTKVRSSGASKRIQPVGKDLADRIALHPALQG